MKTQNEKTVEIIKGTEKGIYNELRYWINNRDRNDNLNGDTFMELISKNSNNEDNKLVALNCIENDINPTKDEAIELTYEISKNKSFFLKLMDSYNDKCKDTALEVLREMYPRKSDDELKKMIR